MAKEGGRGLKRRGQRGTPQGDPRGASHGKGCNCVDDYGEKRTRAATIVVQQEEGQRGPKGDNERPVRPGRGVWGLEQVEHHEQRFHDLA